MTEIAISNIRHASAWRRWWFPFIAVGMGLFQGPVLAGWSSIVFWNPVTRMVDRYSETSDRVAYSEPYIIFGVCLAEPVLALGLCAFVLRDSWKGVIHKAWFHLAWVAMVADCLWTACICLEVWVMSNSVPV